jgi:hypothetical protein
MAQKLTSLYIHAIFSTKNRTNIILAEPEKELFAYIGGILKNNESKFFSANSINNHIRLVLVGA